MAWLQLIVAGLLEVAWAVGLKHTDGFSRPLASLATLACITVSMLLLSVASRTIPIGTAYAVWVGIGACGTAVVGIVLHGEPRTVGRLFFLTLLIVAIIGLRATAAQGVSNS
ncbi:MAG: multidrug efflux SMR transporter [Pirellulales bacterium]